MNKRNTLLSCVGGTVALVGFCICIYGTIFITGSIEGERAMWHRVIGIGYIVVGLGLSPGAFGMFPFSPKQLPNWVLKWARRLARIVVSLIIGVGVIYFLSGLIF